MSIREIRRFSRRELLELVIKQEKENAALREQLAECEEELKRREIDIQEAGTLAEASLRLNKVFEAADEAAKQYLENIRRKGGAPEQYDLWSELGIEETDEGTR